MTRPELLAVLVTPWRVLLLNGLGCAIALLEIRLPAILGWIGLAGIVASAAIWAGGGGSVFML